MFKIKSAIAAFMITVTMLGAVPAHAVQYATIADIREETKDGWHETYMYKGEEIRVDLEIGIPDVDKVPAVLIKFPENLERSYVPANADIFEHPPAGFGYFVLTDPDSLYSHSSKPAGSDRYAEDDAQAENSPLTAAEALAFAKEQLEPYVKSLGDFDLELSYMDAWSRTYEAIDRTSSGDILDYSKPLTEMGYYDIIFNQTFQGIPYTQTGISFDERIKAEDKLQGFITGEAMVTVGSEDNYSLLFAPAQFDSLFVDDLPLAPFSEIKKEIETLIETGYVRDIYWLRLVYVCLHNPIDDGQTGALVPVWELSGEVMRNPKAATTIFSAEEMLKLKKFGGVTLLINAQTGKHYNPKDKSPDRSHAKYITWDDVK